MNTIETKRYQMLVRLNQFGKDHTGLFPETSEAQQHFSDIAAAVGQLSGNAVEKMRAVDEGRSTKAAARAALARRLRAFSRTARLIAKDNVGMADKFVYPDPKTDQTLITAGRMFVQDAEPFTNAFIGQGMAATCVADLKSLVDQFDEAIQERTAGADAHAQARMGIARALASGTEAAKKLDVMMVNHPVDALTVALWKRDRRIGHPRRERGPAQPDPTQAPPASGTADASAAAEK